MSGNNIYHATCLKCGEPNGRKHVWCAKCFSAWRTAARSTPLPDHTQCTNGHPYTPENTYRVKGTGTRKCRTCMRASKLRYDKRKRAIRRLDREARAVAALNAHLLDHLKAWEAVAAAAEALSEAAPGPGPSGNAS